MTRLEDENRHDRRGEGEGTNIVEWLAEEVGLQCYAVWRGKAQVLEGVEEAQLDWGVDIWKNRTELGM